MHLKLVDAVGYSTQTSCLLQILLKALCHHKSTLCLYQVKTPGTRGNIEVRWNHSETRAPIHLKARWIPQN